MRATANIAKLTGYWPVGCEFDRAIEKTATAGRAVKSTALACAAPFIGLAFVVALPFIGLGVLAWMAARAVLARYRNAVRVARNVALFFAAPFVGLAYAIAFPVVGAGALVWLGIRAAWKRPARA